MNNKYKRIQRIYELRVQMAQRERAAVHNVQVSLEERCMRMNEVLVEEVDGCNSIERAPFDFAARYYRATMDRIQSTNKKITDVKLKVLQASDILGNCYRKQKEYEVYVARRMSAKQDQQRRKSDELARQHSNNANSIFINTHLQYDEVGP